MSDYKGIDGLLAIMQRLRDKDHGCDWDKKQTFASISTYTIEEAYEVRDAINRQDMDDLKDELGDLLLQVVFHSQIATEQEAFTFADVCDAINNKMVRRHPHVFANKKLDTVADIKAMWESVKAQEKQQKRNKLAQQGITPDDMDLSLNTITPSLPAVIRGQKTIKTAIRQGFDWETIDGVFDKLTEEVTEIKTEINNQDKNAIADEMGDIFFCTLILATKLNLNAETVMNNGIDKFTKRFNAMERHFKVNNKEIKNATLDEMETIWQQVKQK